MRNFADVIVDTAKTLRQKLFRMPGPSAQVFISLGLGVAAGIFFGEMIPDEALEFSHQWVNQCRVVLVVGTSAEVAPASHMPLLAKRRGALVIEINIEPTLLTPSVTDIFLPGMAGEVLPQLSHRVRELM